MKTLDVDEKPVLCLFATKDIPAGSEILYDYGIKNLPWVRFDFLVIHSFILFRMYKITVKIREKHPPILILKSGSKFGTKEHVMFRCNKIYCV